MIPDSPRSGRYSLTVERVRVEMANPKRRHSKSRTGKRRAHDALTPVGTGECPQCHEPKLSHRVCPHCGYYRGRQVRPVKDAT